MSSDKLIVQVAIRVRLPRNTKITKKVLNQILQKMVEGKKLPPNVEIRGIFWRNPNRAGNGGAWRYHHGADLSAGPSGDYSYPRGTLQDAIDTLAPFIETGDFTL